MPDKCPICQGRGSVPQGFYDYQNPVYIGTVMQTEGCRRCGGLGTVESEPRFQILTIPPEIVGEYDA